MARMLILATLCPETLGHAAKSAPPMRRLTESRWCSASARYGQRVTNVSFGLRFDEMLKRPAPAFQLGASRLT